MPAGDERPTSGTGGSYRHRVLPAKSVRRGSDSVRPCFRDLPRSHRRPAAGPWVAAAGRPRHGSFYKDVWQPDTQTRRKVASWSRAPVMSTSPIATSRPPPRRVPSPPETAPSLTKTALNPRTNRLLPSRTRRAARRPGGRHVGCRGQHAPAAVESRTHRLGRRQPPPAPSRRQAGVGWWLGGSRSRLLSARSARDSPVTKDR